MALGDSMYKIGGNWARGALLEMGLSTLHIRKKNHGGRNALVH